jgi:hypothetical protein
MNTNKLYPIDYSPSNLAIASHTRPLTAKQPLPALRLRNSDVRRIAVCRYPPANTGMRPKAVTRGDLMDFRFAAVAAGRGTPFFLSYYR